MKRVEDSRIIELYWKREEHALSLIHIYIVAEGVGHDNIITMCLIFLAAGAFSGTVTAAGGADSTVYPVSYTHLDVYKRQACHLHYTVGGRGSNPGAGENTHG